MNSGKKILILVVVIFVLSFVPDIAISGPADNLNLENTDQLPQLGTSPNMGWLLFRYILAVMAVLGLTVYGAKFVANKFNPSTATSGNWVQVLDQIALGTNKGLMLVEIEGKGYVLGVSDHSINVISTIEDQERLDELRSLTVKPIKKDLFSIMKTSSKKRDFNQSLDKYIERSRTLGERGKTSNE